MYKSLKEALVRLLEAHVFANDRDLDRRFRSVENLNGPLPPLKIWRPRPHVKLLDDLRVEPLFMKDQRHFVDPFHVFGGNDRFLFYVTKMRDFRFDFSVKNAIRSTQKDIGLDPQSPSAPLRYAESAWS